MSKAGEILKKSNISFIIPEVNNFGYSKVSNNLWAVIFVVNKGYIETDSLECCKLISLYADKYMKEYYTPVGGIDSVRKADDKIVYRQRFYFNDISKLFRVMKYFDITLKLPKSFKVNKKNISKFRDIYSGLKKSLAGNSVLENFTVEKWITYSSLLQLLLYAKNIGVNVDSYMSIEDLSIHGILDYAPYLCGSYDKGKDYIKNTSVIIPNDKFVTVDLYTHDGIVLGTQGKSISLRGFVDKD